MGKNFFLKSNIQVEPLFNKWYAWVHLISPATAALNLKRRYLSIMNSYISNPAIHEAAIKDPNMRGGPFMDIDRRLLKDVLQLRASIIENNREVLSFADAVQELAEKIKSFPKGESLEPYYQHVPDLLRGYVELCYDLNDNPGFRFYESMLYKSPFYNVKAQSISLSQINRDFERPFILSTPRIEDENTLQLQLPFASEALDDLFRMKKQSNGIDLMAEKLGVQSNEQRRVFQSLFTEERPPSYERYEGDNVRIRYFGHACILVEFRGVSILIDPVLSYTYESSVSKYTYDDLPDEIDYVLVTHAHQDHILLETLIQIRHKVKCIVVGRNMDGLLQDPSLKLMLTNLGFRNVIEIRELEEITFSEGLIMGIPFIGEHHDIMINSKLSYFIRLGEYKMLSVADSCNIEPHLYKHVRNYIGQVDLLFLGMECDGSPPSWVYGPLYAHSIPKEFDVTRRGRGCNFEEGMQLVNTFDCKEVYVYAMGLEPWLRHILDLELTEYSNPIQQSRKLIEHCKSKGIFAELLFGEREISLK